MESRSINDDPESLFLVLTDPKYSDRYHFVREDGVWITYRVPDTFDPKVLRSGDLTTFTRIEKVMLENGAESYLFASAGRVIATLASVVAGWYEQ